MGFSVSVGPPPSWPNFRAPPFLGVPAAGVPAAVVVPAPVEVEPLPPPQAASQPAPDAASAAPPPFLSTSRRVVLRNQPASAPLDSPMTLLRWVIRVLISDMHNPICGLNVSRLIDYCQLPRAEIG